ncbi:hypothetical protein J3E72DRAFT_266986 [Bipolaris maydis]|nr:hypothetical protein J3E72DRAFT_266986 [Bipolaris maydis]
MGWGWRVCISLGRQRGTAGGVCLCRLLCCGCLGTQARRPASTPPPPLHPTPPPSLHAARTCACPSPSAHCRFASLVVTTTTTFIIITFIMTIMAITSNNKSSSSSPLPPMLFSSRAHESALWPPNHHAVGHATCDW